MAKKLPKLSNKVLTIIIAIVAVIVIISIISLITALISDPNRLEYTLITEKYIQDLEAQTPTRQYECLDAYVGTYAVVDIKDTYRGGIFAKSKLTIPATYKGKKVTSIISLQSLQRTKELVISDGIVNITNSAFSNCSFETVVIPSSVSYIGTYAFQSCASLKTITLPDNVTSMSDGLFRECRSLTSVSYSVDLTTIGKNVFQNCRSLETFTLPEVMTEIPDGLFDGCSALTSVNLDNITSIGTKAFANCSRLYVTTENGAKYLGKGDNSHYFLIEIADADIEACTINSETVSIAGGAFAGAQKLASIVIPNSVTTWGSGVFSNCIQLTDVSFGNGLTDIPANAFSGCKVLTTINVPGNIEVINDSAFANCDALENVTLNAGLKKMGASIFSGCKELTTITFNGTKAQWNEISVGTTNATKWDRNATKLKTIVCTQEPSDDKNITL